jgi:hypothetical protein
MVAFVFSLAAMTSTGNTTVPTVIMHENIPTNASSLYHVVYYNPGVCTVPITSAAECEAAARALGLPKQVAEVSTTQGSTDLLPPYCFYTSRAPPLLPALEFFGASNTSAPWPTSTSGAPPRSTASSSRPPRPRVHLVCTLGRGW